MSNIEWFNVPGFPFVQVTRDCRVRSIARVAEILNRWGRRGKRRFPSREYRPYTGSGGYLRVAVHHPDKGRRHPMPLHRLMALTFVGGYQSGNHVNHINGKKLDNRPENLEWVPNEENVRHAWRAGLTGLRGEDNPTSVLTWRRVEAIRRALARGVNVSTISIIAGVSDNTIKRIKDGVAWRNAQG